MSNYDDGLGISIGSKLRNTSDLYPIVRLETNAASGIGWFKGPGEADSVDVNNSYGDADKFLKNVPVKKRSANFVAVLSGVTADENTAYGAFAVSSNPVVYIYKGPITDTSSGNISDEDWMHDDNWQRITGGTGDPVDFTFQTGQGTDLQGGVGSTRSTQGYIDFRAFNNETKHYWYPGANGNTDGHLSFGLADIVAKSTFSLKGGGFGLDYINSTSTASYGFDILNSGEIRVRKASADTHIDGSAISTGTLTTSSTITSSGAITVQSGANSTVVGSQTVTTNKVVATSAALTNIDIGSANLMRIRGAGTEALVAFGFNGANIAPGNAIPTLGGENGTTTINSELYTPFLTPTASTSVDHVLALTDGSKVVKVPIGQLGGESSSSLTEGSGINIVGDVISVNSSVVRTNVTQNIPSKKNIGVVNVTGNTAAGGTVPDGIGFRIFSSAISDVTEYDQEQLSSNLSKKLLYIVEDGGSTRDRAIHKGVSGHLFVNNHISVGEGLTKTVDQPNDRINIGFSPVFIKNNADDASMYGVRSRRLGVHLFTPGEIAAELAVSNPDYTAEQVTLEQNRHAAGGTIFEWVREGGSYVNGLSTNVEARRDAGVMMKAGFTHYTNPNSADSLTKTKFRFSAKAPAVAELTGGSEELAGTVAFDAAAASASQYASGDNAFALQIGTGGGSGVGDRLNEVTIPNLTVKNLSTYGNNYLGGGGTLGGDWTVTGALNVSGVITDNSGTVSGTSVSITGTLLKLGAPDSSNGNTATVDDRDFGIAGVYNYTPDDDSTYEDDEAHVTAFYRDASAPAVTTMAGTTSGNYNPNKPWKLVTSNAPVNVPGNTVLADDADLIYAPLEVGAVAFKGIDPVDTPSLGFLETGAINRVIKNIADAYTIESGAVDPTLQRDWAHWTDAPALVTAQAVKTYVDAAVSGVTLGSAAASFDFGLGTGSGEKERVSAFNSANYNASNADILQTVVDGSAKTATLAQVGLAIDFDTDQSDRPTIGYMPGEVDFKSGSTLRSILKKMLKKFEVPVVAIQGTDYVTLLGGGDANERLTLGGLYVQEHGTSYGDQPQTNVSIVVTHYNNLGTTGSFRFKTELNDVGITKSGGGAMVGRTIANISELQSTTPVLNADATVVSTGTGIYSAFINLDRDVDADDLNGIGAANSTVTIDNGVAEGRIKYSAKITAIDESAYLDGQNESAVAHEIRRRSFFFVSNWDIRSWLDQMSTGTAVTLDSTVVGPAAAEIYIDVDGNYSASAGTGFSNKLMHYMICSAGAGGSTILGSGDVISDSNGSDITFDTSMRLITTNTSLENTVDATSLKFRHAVDVNESGTTPLESTSQQFYGSHNSSATDLRRIAGHLARKSHMMGTSQAWQATQVCTSQDGYIYRAFPIEFAGATASDLTNWGENPQNPAYGVKDDSFGLPSKDLLFDHNGNPATFTITNQYGEDQVYVLFQSNQTGSGLEIGDGIGEITTF